MRKVFSKEQIVAKAAFSQEDRKKVERCKEAHNGLGYAYQMAFVRIMGRFPSQKPLEIYDELLDFVSVEFGIPPQAIEEYAQRQATVSEHCQRIRRHLRLKKFKTPEEKRLKQFLFDEACRIEQTSALRDKAKQWLQDNSILVPTQDTLRRITGEVRSQARTSLFQRIMSQLQPQHLEKLDNLLVVPEEEPSPLQMLKEPPGQPSANSLKALTVKLDTLHSTDVLQVDLAWMNNNFQKSLARQGREYNAYRLREMAPSRRYAILSCFLWQTYCDTLDHMVEMLDKMLTKREKKAKEARDEQIRIKRRFLKKMLELLLNYGKVLIDEEVPDEEVRAICFEQMSRQEFKEKLEEVREWLNNNPNHVFPFLVKQYNALRQFSPHLLENLPLESSHDGKKEILQAVSLIRDMNAEKKRKVPEEVPVDFIPPSILDFVIQDGEVNRHAYEWAVVTVLRNEIKRGNLQIPGSKRFCSIESFFMPDDEWSDRRIDFFQRAKLPSAPKEVASYLTHRLNTAFDAFLEMLPDNTYVSLDEEGWNLSRDTAEELSSEAESQLEILHNFLEERMPPIKLPHLLIEVDNELHFTRLFMAQKKAKNDPVQEVCNVIATIMAHGCNLGAYTMAQLTEGVSYHDIQRISDWYLQEEVLRRALAGIVNAIKTLDTSRVWGEGKTSSSDGQRFLFSRKVLQRTYSPCFGDFALEFYTFVADNYAPFYSLPIECSMRDAAYVLDGLLYHESDLEIEEHYVDTHGYTELNYAAFGMLGRRFHPRIKGLKHQWIYRIDKEKNYGALAPLIEAKGHTLDLDLVCKHWDRMGHFYASLESGHATASTALQRLIGFGAKNDFYRANRELGRIFKTEEILDFLSNPPLRRRKQRGLLKNEQLHGLAREVFYGKEGKIKARDVHQLLNTSNCLVLILACIVYRQAKEISRILSQFAYEIPDVDLALLSHISPISWKNVILYGDYVLDKNLIRLP